MSYGPFTAIPYTKHVTEAAVL